MACHPKSRMLLCFYAWLLCLPWMSDLVAGAPRPVTVSDIVAALPGDVDHMDVARASRIWRKGVIRTFIAGNTPPTPEIIAEGLLHNETWSYYPDDSPRSYLWLLYMDDDTVFFPGALLHLLPDFDPDMPYFLTDHLWFEEPGDKQATHPHRGAPRCLPCHYDVREKNASARAFPAPVGCPCTPRLLCEAAPHVFNEHCDMPRHPAVTFSMHGGAGAVLSIGLMRVLDLDFMEACSLSLQSTGGDAFISICLWQAGYYVTDPGPSVYSEGTFSFDPGPEDRLGALNLLAAYIDGHREGADRHWVTTCDAKCDAQLRAMVSLHIRSRSFAGLDDAAAFIKAITAVYETYQEIRTNKEAREQVAKKVETLASDSKKTSAASSREKGETATRAAAVMDAVAGGTGGAGAGATLEEESLRLARDKKHGKGGGNSRKTAGKKPKNKAEQDASTE